MDSAQAILYIKWFSGMRKWYTVSDTILVGTVHKDGSIIVNYDVFREKMERSPKIQILKHHFATAAK